jgi:hypothetical protein
MTGTIERERTSAVGMVAVMLMCAVGLMLMLAPVPITSSAQAGSPPELRLEKKSKAKNPSPAAAAGGDLSPKGRGGEQDPGVLTPGLQEGGGGGTVGEVLGDVAAVGLPPGTVVEIVDNGWITTTESGSGVGVGAEAVGDKLSESFDGSAPNVGLSGGGISSGGGAKRTGKASAFVPPEGLAQNPLIWAGIACGLLAVAAGVYLKNVKAAMALGGLGAAFIVAALFPGFLLLIVAGAAVVGGVVYLRSEQVKGQYIETTRALVAAIDHPDVPVDAKKNVAATLAMEADTADKRVIAKVRAVDAPLAFAGTG